MKTTKRILSTVLVICILTTGVGVFAEARPIDDYYSIMWTNTDAISAGLTIGTLGYATCSVAVELTNLTDTATLYMYLQRYNSGTWSTVDSWDYSGSDFVYGTEHYFVTSGYTYRVRAIAYIYNSMGTYQETATQNSIAVNY